MYLTTYGELRLDRIDSSLCRNADEENSADLTAKNSPEFVIASETVAVEPRPMIGPLVQFCSSIGTEQAKTEEIDRESKLVERERF